MFGYSHWEACSFWKGNQGGVESAKQRRGGREGLGERGNCSKMYNNDNSSSSSIHNAKEYEIYAHI